MMTTNIRTSSWVLLVLSVILCQVKGQETSTSSCYSSGSLATAIVLTFFCTILLIGVLLYLWNRRQRNKKDNHLILETDPERGGKADFAFDNPGFKDTTLVAASEKNSKLENGNKAKWTQWTPLSGLHLKSSEKKRALDDSNLEHQVKVVALKSQDFTGLGFNICGNMREGIYIKDILHRGPAFESGKLSPGDRINSVTISFEHMVYEDALNILSYASPYEVIVEAKTGKVISFAQNQGQTPIHPIYRSSSLTNLFHTEKSAKKKLFGDDYSSGSNYSSLQKSRSNMTTLERKDSKSPRPNLPKSKKNEISPHKMTPEMLKTHLELKISDDELKVKDRMQKTENKAHKFGVKVLPVENLEKSPKITEQNQNNLNIEKNMEDISIRGIDEVDVNKPQPPQAKKREKKFPDPPFQRNDSGIKRDKNGIPLEIPNHMFDAAVAARRNRKSAVESNLAPEDEINIKVKAKAPPPPTDAKLNFGNKTRAFEDLSNFGMNDSPSIENNLSYGSDSEDETDHTLSSVNTIELNSKDIMIHQTEEQERKARKTASTGDLSKMKKAPRSNTGTLERAQSLDITDTSGSSLTKNRTYDARENLLIDKEPRLSLILDGLNTFQRSKLKKSTEWGNLEDVILSFDRDDEEWEQKRKSEPQFNAVMNRVIQIKRESEEIEIIPDEVIKEYQQDVLQKSALSKVTNKIWPDEREIKSETSGRNKLETEEPSYARRQQVPIAPERTFNSSKTKTNEIRECKKELDDVVVFNFEEKHEKENGEKIIHGECVSNIDVNGKRPNSKNNSLLNLAHIPNSNISVEYECIRPVPPRRERTPEKEAVIDLTNKVSVTSFEKHGILETCSQIAKGRNPDGEMIKDEWEIDSLNKTSPPASMTLVEEVMESYNNNRENAVTVVASLGPPSSSSNVPDETKTAGNLKNATEDFIFNEKSVYELDTNIPDDVKVSRHTLENFETKKTGSALKSDHFKPEDALISHVMITENGASNLHSLELSINNEPSELYTTALENTIANEGVNNEVTVIVSRPVRKLDTPTKEPLVEITENSFSKVTKSIEDIPVNISGSKHEEDFKVEITESKYSILEIDKPTLNVHIHDPLIESPPKTCITENNVFKSIDDESPAMSLTEVKISEDENTSPSIDKKTYITEIQVLTPNDSTVTNVSEVKIKPQNEDHLESAFENYVKNFESKLEAFESNMQNFENNLEEFMRDEPKPIILEEKHDVEKQVSKIQEIAEEQLKTLPEMRFTTSSYEADRKTPEKRHSFELLRSNFEKGSNERSPPKRENSKSRIPISTTMKTPPTSPERRDSRNLENENEKALLELMSSPPIHSTPFTSKIKPPSVSSKNISVTSIRNNSKIPSGLPTLSSKPPIVPRKNEDSGISSNGGAESSFKQWVFNPTSNVSNVTVGKDK